MKEWPGFLSLRRCQKALVVYYLVFGVSFGLLSQSNKALSWGEPIYVQTWYFNQDDGLSQGMIMDFEIDSLGYLWIATKDGLNRFDGKNFKVFRPQESKKGSISNGFIADLFIDSKNRLWVLTKSGDINLYNQYENRFINLEKLNSSGQNLSSNRTNKICELASGDLILNQKDGSFGGRILNAKSRSIRELAFKYDSLYEPLPKILPFSNSNFQISLSIGQNVADKEGNLWFYVKDSLYKITPEILAKGGRAESFRLSTIKVKEEIHERPLRIIPISNYYDNKIYTVPNYHKVERFDKTSNSFITILDLPDSIRLAGRIFIDQQNYLWSLQADGNFIKISLNTHEIQKVIIWDIEIRQMLKQHRVAAHIIDKAGNIWLGLGGAGIIKVAGNSEIFQPLNYNPKNEYRFLRTHNLTSNFSYNYDLELQLEQKLNEDYLKTKNQYFTYIGFFGHFTIDANQTLWAATSNESGGYFTGFSLIDDSFESIPLGKDTLGKDIHPWLSFISKDSSIWMATQSSNISGPLIKFNTSKSAIDTFYIPLKTKSISLKFITDCTEDKDGLLWFSAIDGIYALTPSSHKWKYFNVSESGNQNIYCLSLLPDPVEPSKFLWIGTDGNGLIKFNKQNGVIQTFNIESGLPNNVVYAVLSDFKGNLWLSTNNGLCLFDTKSYVTKNFGKPHGLPFTEFDRFKYAKDKLGNLYFQGAEGVIKVNPKAAYQVIDTPKVVLNQFKVLNKQVEFDYYNKTKEGFVLTKPIEFLEELELTHDLKMISIGFSLSDLSEPSRNQYQYKLEGFSKSWIDAGNDQEAIFTNLSPGNYTFKVRGRNKVGEWSPIRELEIRVIPPFWSTWWFRVLIIFSLIGIVYLIYNYRLSQAIAIERMRNEIAQDLHDEIGSTLSSISLYSATIQLNNKELPMGASKLLDKVINATSTVMSSMNDLVWTIKVENDSFSKVINRLRAFAADLTESKNIKLQFDVDERTGAIALNMKQRKNIYLIFKEAITNAIKYSNATVLFFAINKKPYGVEIICRDNGIGFNFEEEQKNNNTLGGNGVSGMFFRAKELKAELFVNSKLNEGTEVKLILRG